MQKGVCVFFFAFRQVQKVLFASYVPSVMLVRRKVIIYQNNANQSVSMRTQFRMRRVARSDTDRDGCFFVPVPRRMDLGGCV